MKKTKRIPTIVVVFILSLGLGLGVILVQYKSIFRLQANPDFAPQGIKITNINDSSFTVSWTTGAKTLGAIVWGGTASLGRLATSTDQTPKDVHYITINDLLPSTTYYFKINSAGGEFDNSGIPWQIKTIQKKTPVNASQISGVILNPSGQPAQNVIVSLTISGSHFSDLTSANGSWVISLSNIEVAKNILLQIFANGGSLGASSAQVYLASVPIPPMTLGKTYDFRNLIKDNPNLPAVQLQVPKNPEP